MDSYQQEALAAGATHVGEKGRVWRVSPRGNWQVFKLGRGWVDAAPTSRLTELYNHKPEVVDNPPVHWLDVVQAFKALRKEVIKHERNFTHSTLCDLRLAFNRLEDLINER